MRKHSIINLTRDSESETEQSPRKKVKTGGSGRNNASVRNSKSIKSESGRSSSARVGASNTNGPTIKIEEEDEDDAIILAAANVPEDDEFEEDNKPVEGDESTEDDEPAEDPSTTAAQPERVPAQDPNAGDVLEEQWSQARNKLLRGIEGRDDKGNCPARFENQYRYCKSLFLQYRWSILPPPFNFKLTSIGAMQDEQARKIRDEIERLVTKSWDDALAETDKNDRQKRSRLRKDRKEALHLWEWGRLIWLPGEDFPTDEPVDTIAKDLGFGGDFAGIPGDWTFLTTLGWKSDWNVRHIGPRHIGLWVKVGENGNITERMEVKENYFVTRNWWDWQKWWYDLMSNRIPNEVAMLEKLKKCPGNDHIVKICGHGIYEMQRMYRVYTEFCPHGDLENLIVAHVEAGKRIPVRFLWAVFEMLATTLIIMRHGGLWKDEDGFEMMFQPFTNPILHHNIMPASVLLVKPREEGAWAKLPLIKLGNFDEAALYNDGNEHSRAGAGTLQYAAPEQQGTQRTMDAAFGRKIYAWSDLWSVGRVMLSLMNLEHFEIVEPCMPTDDMEDPAPQFTAEAKEEYPEGLTSLVESCLIRDFYKRIRLDDLFKLVCERAKTSKHRAPSKMDVVLYEDDKYTKLAATELDEKTGAGALFAAADVPEDEDEDDIIINPVSVEEQWQEAAEMFYDRKPKASRHLRARFEEQREIAIELSEKHDWYIGPKRLVNSVDLKDFIEQQGCDIHRQIYRRVKEAWDEAVRLCPATDDKEKRYRQRLIDNGFTALGYVSSYGLVWLPGEPQPVTDMLIRAKKLGFTGGHPGIDGEWRFQASLGSTIKAHAGLWVQVDDEGSITSRTAVKENWINFKLPEDPIDEDVWMDAKLWDGPFENRYPMEVSMMEALNKCKNSEAIVTCRGHGIYDVQKMFRIYMEFCAHGSLENLIEEHQKAGRWIPQRFIWATFEAMAEALCLLKNGCLPDQERDVKDDDGFEIMDRNPWEAMRHQDVKPDNIFLSARNSGTWPRLPLPKLGDYGTTYRESFAREHKIFGIGTEKYMAPEMHLVQMEAGYKEGAKISPASDLWAIGKVIIAMINMQPSDKAEITEFGSEMPRVSEAARRQYQDLNLIDLAEECVQEEIDDRPTAEGLWKRIRAETELLRHEQSQSVEQRLLHRDDVYKKFGSSGKARFL